MIEVGGQVLEFDVREELEIFLDQFKKLRFRDNKIQSCSPFRDEKTPSFAVHLDNGSWIDSGAGDEKYRKGHFIELLAFLMEVELKEAEQYLVSKYGIATRNLDDLKLTFTLQGEQESTKVFTPDELAPFMYTHPYLFNRGISEKTQRAFKIGYDTKNDSIMLPWMDRLGNVVNLKFRSIANKRFYYSEEGQRIINHVYGLNFILKFKFKEAVLVESEIDCMYLWTNGIPAIATGKAGLSDSQYELLKSSCLEEIIIATDNDKAGHRFREYLAKKLVGRFEVSHLHIPTPHKDVNDLKPQQLLELYQNRMTGLAMELYIHKGKRQL